MAKFLQETIAETGVPGSDDARAAKEFGDFFRKVSGLWHMMNSSAWS
jgi:LETM1 and EF-hand domain-containing protein 1